MFDEDNARSVCVYDCSLFRCVFCIKRNGFLISRSPIGTKVFALNDRLHQVVDLELMKFDQNELRILQVIYGENFHYPIHDHILEMMSGVPENEVIH